MIYVLDSEDQLITLAERIATAIGAEVLSKHEALVESVYLDSFDWLFHQSGVKLQTETGSAIDGKKLILRWISDTPALSPPAAVHLDKLPETADELPVGKMHDGIHKVLGLRSLIPVARVRSRQVKLAVRDQEGKTLCRLILEHNHARTKSGRRSVDLGCRLRLESLLGYEKVFSKTSKLLGRLEGVAHSKDDVFENAVKATGRTPGDYCSKIKTSLKRDWRVDQACRLILLDQLDQIEWNIEGTIADIDTEFLHDLRVATRRSRALMNRLKNAFPISIYKRFSKELAWVSEITTPLRDMDVFMLDYPKYHASLRPGLRQSLMPFYDFLSAHHKTEQAILNKKLTSRRFEKFRTSWRACLQKPLPKRPSASLGPESIGKISDIRIWKTYRRLIKQGLLVTERSPPTDLHELRKTCKKLRYLLEFFSDLYSKKEIKEIIIDLKNFQENLGAFQDLDVQASKLINYREEMSHEGEVLKKTFMAMEVLIENMNMQKKLVRREFAQRFSTFSSTKVEKEFRNLCGRGTPAKKHKKR